MRPASLSAIVEGMARVKDIHSVQWGSYSFNLGYRLRTIRGIRGISQYRLTELSGISRTTISNLERNESPEDGFPSPSLLTVYELARGLHVPPCALMPGVGSYVTPRFEGPHKTLEVEYQWPNLPNDNQRFDKRYRSGGAFNPNPTFEE